VGEPRKTVEDHEIEARVRAWLQHEIDDRGISRNAMERKLGLGRGTLTRIMKGSRGFSPGLLLAIVRRIGIRAAQLLQEDPPTARPGESPGPTRASQAHGQAGKPQRGGRARKVS